MCYFPSVDIYAGSGCKFGFPYCGTVGEMWVLFPPVSRKSCAAGESISTQALAWRTGNVGVVVSCDLFFDRTGTLESGVRPLCSQFGESQPILNERFYFLYVVLMQLILVSKPICVYVHSLRYFLINNNRIGFLSYLTPLGVAVEVATSTSIGDVLLLHSCRIFLIIFL